MKETLFCVLVCLSTLGFTYYSGFKRGEEKEKDGVKDKLERQKKKSGDIDAMSFSSLVAKLQKYCKDK